MSQVSNLPYMFRNLIRVFFIGLRTFKQKIYFDIFFEKKSYSKNPDVLFSSFSVSWREFIHSDGKKYRGDLMIGEVVDKSRYQLNNILCIDQSAILQNHKVAREKNANQHWLCVEQFFSYNDIFLSFYLSLKKILNGSLDEKYENLFQLLNPVYVYDTIFSVLTSQRIIEKINPKSIFLTCEYCRFHRELTFISKRYGIPIFALQHGVINPYKQAYIFDNSRIKDILPDVTFVFGKYYKNLLTEKSIYNSSEVIVTGDPRYDILYYADEIYSKDDFKKRYKIPSNHKIVLWTTQCHGRFVDDEENLLNFETVFDSISKMKNTSLIVKQHPNEPEKYTQMIKKAQKMFDANILLVPKNSDTFEQLYVSDVMLTRDSTTALEAVALDKPVLILNLGDRPDRVDFVKQGVAKGVYNSEDFKPTLEVLLKDDSSLIKNREKYIEEYLYKIDGESSERVVDAVKRVIND